MQLKDFIGKVVVNTQTGKRYVLREITAPSITAQCLTPDIGGHYTRYCWNTINGDPITNGILAFEDPALTDLFKTVFDAHSRSKDGYWEEYGYWMRRD